MQTEVTVAIITASASIVVAAVSFLLSKWKERADALQERKRAHYQELLAAISDLADHGIELEKARRRFASAVNTIVLVAPQSVIAAVMDYYQELSSDRRNPEHRAKLLKSLILEFRGGLGLPFSDDLNTFKFELVGVPKPRDNV